VKISLKINLSDPKPTFKVYFFIIFCILRIFLQSNSLPCYSTMSYFFEGQELCLLRWISIELVRLQSVIWLCLSLSVVLNSAQFEGMSTNRFMNWNLRALAHSLCQIVPIADGFSLDIANNTTLSQISRNNIFKHNKMVTRSDRFIIGKVSK